jgi:O-antigen/teichoic acid export membrane protein
MFSTAIAELMVMLGYFLTIFRNYFKWSFNKAFFRENFRIAIPLIPSAIIGIFVAVIDRRLIAQHHGLADLANYNLTMQALAPIQMLMSAVQVAWSPHLFSIKDNRKALSKSVSLMAVALVTMSAIVMLIAFAVYHAIFTNYISLEYKEVPLLILYASVGSIASALIHLNNNMFVQLGITKEQLVVAMLLLGSNWILNLMLIPSYSYYGAVIAAGISNILALAIGLLLIYKAVNRKNIYAV